MRGVADVASYELHKAVFHGDLEGVRHMLRDVGNPTVPDMHGKQQI